MFKFRGKIDHISTVKYATTTKAVLNDTYIENIS